MDSGNHHMVLIGNQRLLFLCLLAPEDKYDPSWLAINPLNNAISQDFPTFPTMRIRRMRAHRPDGIEQEHSLAGPGFQTSVIWHPASEILRKFSIYILEGRWDRSYVRLDGEAQTMRHARRMIGILAQQHDLDRIIGRHL